MIRNLLFDLGGVIMDIEKSRCVEAFTELGLKNAADYFGDFVQQGPFMQIENGDITPDEFHRLLRRELPAGTTDAAIDAAFCRFLVGIPPHRLRDLRELRRRFKVYLLSNTNPIMWASTIKDEFTREGLQREDYFDGIVTSFAARSMKPDRRIFEYAVEHLGIDPSETLFIDDSQSNLEAAAKLGFEVALAAPGREFSDIIALAVK